jgi:hypothetical protein
MAWVGTNPARVGTARASFGTLSAEASRTFLQRVHFFMSLGLGATGLVALVVCVESRRPGLHLTGTRWYSRAPHRRAALGFRLRARGGKGQRQHGGGHVLRLRGLKWRDLLGHLPALHRGLHRQHLPRHRRNVRRPLDLRGDDQARPVQHRQLLHDGPGGDSSSRPSSTSSLAVPCSTG